MNFYRVLVVPVFWPNGNESSTHKEERSQPIRNEVLTFCPGLHKTG